MARLWKDPCWRSQGFGYTWTGSAGSKREWLGEGWPSDAIRRCVICRDALWRATWFSAALSFSYGKQPHSLSRMSALCARALAAVRGPKEGPLEGDVTSVKGHNQTFFFFSVSLFFFFSWNKAEWGRDCFLDLWPALMSFAKWLSSKEIQGLNGAVCASVRVACWGESLSMRKGRIN